MMNDELGMMNDECNSALSTHNSSFNKPAIRFKGFSGEWVESSAGIICDYIVPGRNKPRKFNGGIPWVTTPDITSNTVSKSKIGLAISREEIKRVGAKIIPINAIIISCVGDLGIVAKVENELVINQQLHAFIPKETIHNWFLLYGLIIRKKYMENVATKTAVPYMNKENCNSIPIIYPTHAEQTQIGNFFQQLDRLIAQHQQKHDKLRCVKKALLEKMFPDVNDEFRMMNDECNSALSTHNSSFNKPAIRFKGFSEPWEEKKLDYICSVITKGTTPLDKSGRGEINYIKVESIDPSSGQIISTSKIKKEEHENYLRRSQLSVGDILFSIAGTLGRITIVDRKYLPANTNQALAIIRLKRENLEYVMTFLKGKVVDEYIKKNPTVGAQPNLSLEQVGNIDIVLPDNKEQTKIGKLFQQLDSLISQQQSQLTKLGNIKQAMLAKMFA